MPSYKQGQSVEQEFADYAPDASPTLPGAIRAANGMVPSVKGYDARNSPVLYGPSGAIPGFNGTTVTPTGGYVAQYTGGNARILVATPTNIYNVSSVAYTSIGGPYTATTRWRFTQFGQDVIAVAANAVPQVATGPAGTFSALGGSPPTSATNVVSIASTVFMTRGTDWFNSAIGTDNNWTPDIQTQAATGTLTDYPGPITALAPLFRNVVIFKRAAMWLGSLVGGEFTWNFQLVSDETGTPVQEAVVTLPEAVAFLGADDFYITDGYAPKRLPNQLKETFFADADPTLLTSMLSWYDPIQSIIWWHYVSKQPAFAGIPDKLIGYNVRVGRWVPGAVSTYYVIPNTQPGATNGLFFDVNGKLQTWTGTPSTGYVTTSYMGTPGQLTQAMRCRVKYSLYPIPSGSPFPESVIPYHLNTLGKVPTQLPQAVLGDDGWHYWRAYDRYHSVQINTNGPCSLSAYAFEYRIGGIR